MLQLEKQKRIDKQEQKTRYITTQMISDIFYNHLLTLEQTKIDCHVDMCFTADNHTYDVEVKTRNKDINKYPYLELKHSKLKNMLKHHQNQTLIYVVMVNDETAYFFNLSQLDWDSINTTQLRIKKVEYLDNSAYECVPVYQIPVSKAIMKVPVKSYLERYALLEERNKKNTIPKKTKKPN